MSQKAQELLEFGPFRLDPGDRLLWRGGEVVPLTPKAIDLLAVLVENAGRLMSKEELIERVWPDAFVEEANLSHQMHRLRTALGDGEAGAKYIETLNRRGYRFVAPVTRVNPVPMRDPGSEIAVAPARDQRRTWWGAIGAAALIALVGYTVIGRFRAQPAELPVDPAIRTLAVLPFTALSTWSHDEAFELGMADAVITRLTNVQQVIIRPTSAVLRYAREPQDALAIGREQQVDAVLEGKILKGPDRIRVTVQLLRVADGRPLWAQSFDEPLEDLFAIQDAISSRVVDALRITLDSQDRTRLAQRRTTNLEAYDAYVRGFFYANSYTKDSFEKSVAEFRRAIAIDAEYVEAYAGLAGALAGTSFERRPLPEVLDEAKRHAARALQLDEASPEAHAAMVSVNLYVNWDWQAAERECRRLVALRPNTAPAHQLYGWYLMLMGRNREALEEIQVAQRLDPLSVNITILHGSTLVALGDRARGIAELERIVSVSPAHGAARGSLALALYEDGRGAQAIEMLQREPVYAPAPLRSSLGFLLGRASRRAEAERILAELESANPPAPAYLIAQVMAGLGRTDDAIQWLERAREERSSWIAWLKTDVKLDALRGDPRFKDLLRRVGLERPR